MQNQSNGHIGEAVVPLDPHLDTVPPDLPELQDVDEGLQKPDAEGTGRRPVLAAGPGGLVADATAVGGGDVALAGVGCLPLRRRRASLAFPNCRPTADHCLAIWSRLLVAGGHGRSAVLGAEIVHKPAEAEHLHRERAQHHEEEREPKPPALATQVVVHGEPDVRSHVREVHGHGGQDPEAVPQRVAPLLPSQAQAQRRRARPAARAAAARAARARRATAPRAAAAAARAAAAVRAAAAPSRLRVLGSGTRRQAGSQSLHRARIVRVLQRGERHVAALLHLQPPV